MSMALSLSLPLTYSVSSQSLSQSFVLHASPCLCVFVGDAHQRVESAANAFLGLHAELKSEERGRHAWRAVAKQLSHTSMFVAQYTFVCVRLAEMNLPRFERVIVPLCLLCWWC